MFQENPLPDPAELFTNVYVKGFGTEVFPLFPFAQLFHYKYLVNLRMSLNKTKIMKFKLEMG